MKIFAVYIGGKTPTSNIELHDMRFSAGETIEDCYADLKRQWWGTPSSLHIDAWGELNHADGYDVLLKNEPYVGTEKLYFVNLGGYDPQEFTELHKNVFVVADTESKAKVRALKQISTWKSAHKDHQLEVEQAVSINEAMQKNGLFVHLEKSALVKPFEFVCKYQPLTRTAS